MGFCLFTFEELLASVFLEEGFMCDGTDQVFEHEQEDGLYLLLRVARVLCECSVL